MKKLIEDFTSHLKEAMEIGARADLKKSDRQFKNIVICGLGGSGIGGTIVAQLLADHISVPIVLNKDYSIPSFVNEDTLIIASSYSGNTEETLEAVNAGIAKGAEFCVVTSGGKLQTLAEEKGANLILVPAGMPPRGAFGYSFPQLYFVMEHYGLIDSAFKADFATAGALIDGEEADIKSQAEDMAHYLKDKMGILYSDAAFEGVCVRFRQQLNENSKVLCWHHAIPEMNHNELVGWKQQNDQLAVVVFRNETDHPRTQKRMDLCKGIFEGYTPNVREYWSKGDTMLQRTLYLIHLGDWTSYYLSELNGVDILEIEVINYLKGELAKI